MAEPPITWVVTHVDPSNTIGGLKAKIQDKFPADKHLEDDYRTLNVHEVRRPHKCDKWGISIVFDRLVLVQSGGTRSACPRWRRRAAGNITAAQPSPPPSANGIWGCQVTQNATTTSSPSPAT
jgi:hypothetical protein